MSREFTNIDAALKEDLEKTFGEKVKIENPRAHRLNVTIARDDILEIVRYLHENYGLMYISTITALDAVEPWQF